MQLKRTLAPLLAAVVAISACGKIGFEQEKGNNERSSSLSDFSDGVAREGEKPPSAEVTLQDLNKVIAKFDPIKLMKRLGRTGDFNFETKKISTSSDSWLDSRLQCEASDPGLSDVRCAMIGYRAKDIAQFPQGRIGTYYFPNKALIALCDLAPGEWVLAHNDSRTLVKPRIEGLPWDCTKFDFEPF
jgi:hypothetical protein